MREIHIFRGMAIGATEAFMVRSIELTPFHNPFGAHKCIYLHTLGFIGVLIFCLAVTPEAPFVFLMERRNVC